MSDLIDPDAYARDVELAIAGLLAENRHLIGVRCFIRDLGCQIAIGVQALDHPERLRLGAQIFIDDNSPQQAAEKLAAMVNEWVAKI